MIFNENEWNKKMILNETEWNKNNPEQQFANCAKYDPELQFVIFPPKKMKKNMIMLQHWTGSS